MTGTDKSLIRLLVAVATVIAAPAVPALSQNIPMEEPPAANAQAPRFEMHDQQFDLWLFPGHDRPTDARSWMETQLKVQLDSLDHLYLLSEAQKTHLRLAATADMKRVLDQIERARDKFQELKRDQNRIGEIFQEIQPLQGKMNSGVFGRSSFFRKSLRHTLNPEQWAKFEQADQERLRFHHRATVARLVVMLEDSVPLREEQRRKLLEILLDKTRPMELSGQYQYLVVMCQLSRVPEDSIRPIFDEAQWRVVKQQLAQGRAIESHLKSSHILPEE